MLLLLYSATTIAAAPRLVVLNPYAVEMLFEIGAGKTIIGTVDYADYPSAATKIPRIGRYNHIDFEALLLLEPDAIVIDSVLTSPLLISRLQQLGFKLIDTNVAQLEQIPVRLQQLGEQTDFQQRALVAANKFSVKLAQLKQQYQQRLSVNVFFQLWPKPLTTSATAWLNEIIAGCGGKNIFANSPSDYPQVSIEQVLTAEPDIIIKPVHGDSKQVSDEWAAWPELAAVSHHQIYNINGDLVHRTGPRVLSGMAQICQFIDAARLQKQPSSL
ncbi:cobalamin-binding protein [Photobacterium carnosum]|uniref:cobalamin-binding protein n=1 Tax=Photobacterium carnosum TaxID=2023717 RepID=UPI001E389782|nr:cobalamin-binding protein [Photobacterium carnosum]